MPNINPTFNPAHPFWHEAVEMRKTKSIAEITRAAEDKGFNLSYKQIDTGLRRAPLSVLTPAANALWLRRKYEALESDFNSYTSMRDLAQEAIVKAGECQEALDGEEDLTPARRMILQNERDKWLHTAFNWAEKCARLDIDLGGLLLKEKQVANETAAPKENVADEVAKVLEDFKSQLPKVTNQELLSKYGGNIKLPDKEEHVIEIQDGE